MPSPETVAAEVAVGEPAHGSGADGAEQPGEAEQSDRDRTVVVAARWPSRNAIVVQTSEKLIMPKPL